MRDFDQSLLELRRRLELAADGDRQAAYDEWYEEQLSAGVDIGTVHSVTVLNDIVESMQESAVSADRHLLLLIHGIRTQAEWQGKVSAMLTRPGTTVVPIKYEYLNVFLFWCPVLTRALILRDIHRRLKDAIAEHRPAQISIIAHSFGTYSIAKLLKKHPDLRCDKLILCGAIVPRRFRWTAVPSRPAVVNDCGCRDVLPILAESLSWGYGSSGTFGFGAAGVRDRFHDLYHSDFFAEDFVRRYWEEWVHSGVFVESKFERDRNTTPFWQSTLTWFPLKTLIAVISGVAGWMYLF